MGSSSASPMMSLTIAKKQTKREKFPSEMEAVVPWQALIALSSPTTQK